MRLTRLLSVLGATACAIVLAVPALAATPSPGPTSSGDANNGDVWVDTASGPAPMFGATTAGPGHEQDPHLPCSDVGIFASNMGDATGAFEVFSWPSTGTGTLVYSGTWSYTAGQADPQEIAVIPVSALVPAGHFKLQVGQDPNKFKTFWIDCPSATPSPATTPGTSATPSPATTPGTSTTPTSGTGGAAGTGDVLPGDSTGFAGPIGGVLASEATAAGAVLAETGTPIGLLVIGIILVIGGLGFYSYRRFVANRVGGA